MLLMGPTLPIPVPAALTDALQTVQVTTSSGRASGFQLGFAVSPRSVITRALLPAGLFDPGIRVVLVAVVGGLPTVLMDGIISRQELVPSDDPGASTLTVTGEDLSLVMDLTYERQAWRIADAHRVLDPAELTAAAGTRLRITLPAGLPVGVAMGVPGA